MIYLIKLFVLFSSIHIPDAQSAMTNDQYDQPEIPKALTMNITAYTAGYESTGKTPKDPTYNITSSGEKGKQGITLAAPKSIPFGTKIYIPYFDGLEGWDNEGIFEVQDRGGAIKEGHLDVYMTSVKEALNFGRRNLDVYILGESDTVSRRRESSKESNEPKLIALCPECQAFLGFTKKVEKQLLEVESITCPECRSIIKITQQFKQFILYF